jgi:hypothetical protein
MELSKLQFLLAAGLVSFVVLSAPVFAGAQSPKLAMPAPSIYSIEPPYGGAGKETAIIGFGFSTSNTVLFDTKSILDVPIARQVGITCIKGNSACHPGINQTLVITVPRDATAGQYNVSVQNANGVSNVVVFTVTH